MHSSFGKGGEWGYLYLGQWIALWKGYCSDPTSDFGHW